MSSSSNILPTLHSLAVQSLDLDPKRVLLHGSLFHLDASSIAASSSSPSTSSAINLHRGGTAVIKERFFVLDRAFVLTGYQESNLAVLEPIGAINLAEKAVAMCITNDHSRVGAPFAFRINLAVASEDIAWELFPSSEKVFVDWMTALGLAIHCLDGGNQKKVLASSSASQSASDSLDRHFIRQATTAKYYLDRLSGRMQVIEIIAGVGLLNFLLILILNSSPGHLEAWLFMGSVDILIGWAFVVRFEQLVFGGGPSQRRDFRHSNMLDDEEGGSSSDEEPALPNSVTLAVTPTAVVQNAKKHIVASLSMANGPFPPFGDVSAQLAGYIRLPGHTWAPCQAGHFQIRRGPNYSIEKHHQASQPELFKLVAVDLYYGEMRIDRIAESVVLPDPESPSSTSSSLPQFLVVNFQGCFYFCPRT